MTDQEFHEEIMIEIKEIKIKQDIFMLRAEPVLKAFENTTVVGNFLRKVTIGMLKFLILLGAGVGAWIVIKEFFFKK